MSEVADATRPDDELLAAADGCPTVGHGDAVRIWWLLNVLRQPGGSKR